MKLCRITRLPWIAVSVNDPQSDKVFRCGKVYPADSLSRFSDQELGRECVGDLPSAAMPATTRDVPPFCERWIHFLQGPVAKDLGAPDDITRPLLRGLHDAVGGIRDRPALPPELLAMPMVRHSNLDAVVEVLRRYRDWFRAQLPQPRTPPASDSTDVPDNYADFRNGPDGPLLTAKVCWERFGVSNPVLSKAADKDRSIRRKNPAGGSGYVYRYDVVARIANRKSGDE
jgi:hypothetical protein